MNWQSVDIRGFSEADYFAAYAALDPEKRARVDKIRQKKDKMRTVFGDLLVRRLLKEALSRPEDSFSFVYGEHGKPALADGSYFFSISHCEDIVVAAVSASPIGIDVERIREISPYVAKKYFSPEEQAYLFGHEPRDSDFEHILSPEAKIRFFELWTAKEALLKCRGTGLTHLKSVNTRAFSFERHLLPSDYLIAIYEE